MDQCVVFSCLDPAAPVPVARVALDADGNMQLAYGSRYLARADAFAIDPLHLPLNNAQLLLPRGPDGSYGALSDAGPNAWGAQLTGSICRATDTPAPATPIEWLLRSWHYGAGCLGFADRPDAPPRLGVAPAGLEALSGRIVRTLETLATTPATKLDHEAVRLALPGASLGGVRPKTVVAHDGREWIAKFSRPDDRFDVPAAEYATMCLAHLAGVNVPAFEHVVIGGRSVLLVERFDRTPRGGRVHYLSAHTLLSMPAVAAADYQARYSYAGIAESLRAIDDEAVADSHQLFRRMVFNILVGNVDDHLRNHGVLMHSPGKYRLSPAFDLVPHLDAPHLPQSIGVGVQGRASTLDNALSQCGRFQLRRPEAARIVDEVRSAAARWREVFAESGVAERDRRLLGPCLHAADERG